MTIEIGKSLVVCLLFIFSGNLLLAQKTLSAKDYYQRGLAKIKLAQSAPAVQLAENKYKEAAEDFSRAIEIDAENPDYYFSRGKCFYKTLDIEKAIWDFNSVIKLHPEFAEAYIERGKIFADLSLIDEDREATLKRALTDCNTAIKLNSKNAYFYFVRGKLFFSKIENNNRALEDMDNSISIHPNFAEAFILRAEIYFNLKNYEKSIADSTKAITLRPQNADGFSMRGRAYTKMERYDLAVADFTSALKFAPKNPDLYFYRASAYNKLGKKREAKMDKLQEDRLVKIPANRFPEFGGQLFEGLSKSFLDDTSLIDKLR